MKLIDIYDNIVNYVAALPPSKYIRLVELSTDEIVLTTIGNFLDYVLDQIWLEKIRSNLIAKQTQEDVINKVTIFDRHKDNRFFFTKK
ncbi:hypothetical protein [Enterococcus mundtii]|uniref:hypothetical protein n=1 Tax=Enterococcus mundtii TaxID=53346 RepID=UPI001376AC85|nr:hypothetical protein [Enterococcus mundtii]NBA63804.1 hypothetical protein [Enterococcus mundtii]